MDSSQDACKYHDQPAGCKYFFGGACSRLEGDLQRRLWENVGGAMSNMATKQEGARSNMATKKA